MLFASLTRVTHVLTQLVSRINKRRTTWHETAWWY